MSQTVTLDANRQELWRQEVMREAGKQLYFTQNGMMSMNGTKAEKQNGIISYLDELSKKPGDTITMTFAQNLGENTGVTGDNELEGRESAITTASESVHIDQWRDAVRQTGRLDEQKVAYETRSLAKDKLAIRLREMWEKQVFLKLAGITNSSLVDVNGAVYCGTFADGVAVHSWSNTPTAVPNADMAAGTGSRYVCANTGGGDGLGATDLLTPTLLTRAKNKARLVRPRILPVMFKGKEYYVVLVHPWQFTDLQNNAVIAQALRDGWWRGEENPLFSGASLVWNGMIIHEHEYVPFLDVSAAGNNFTAAGAGEDFAVDTFRALLCGVGAAIVANCKGQPGEGPGWNEKEFDYGNEWGIATGFMGGIDKTMVSIDGTAVEYGVVAIDTAATAQ
jgi:N4-gp56 family major capsid protein